MRDPNATLAALEPTGGPNNAVLATDGGGTNGSARRSTLVAEALRRTQPALVSGLRPPRGTGSGQQNRLNTTTSLTPLTLLDWEPWVRIEVVRSRLLGLVELELDPQRAGRSLLSLRAREQRVRVPMVAVSRPQHRESLVEQAGWVARRSRMREDRFAEIHVQVDDLWPFWEAVVALDPLKTPRCFELLRACLLFATSVVLQMKDHLGVPRASVVAPDIMPIVAVPGHGALPSGHATAAFLLSGVLGGLLPNEWETRVMMRRLAFRVAFNREVAGLHYPMDSIAGRLLGEALAGLVIGAATGNSVDIAGAVFDGARIDTENLSDAMAQAGADTALEDLPAVTAPSTMAFGPADPAVRAMWNAARAELTALGR